MLERGHYGNGRRRHLVENSRESSPGDVVVPFAGIDDAVERENAARRHTPAAASDADASRSTRVAGGGGSIAMLGAPSVR